MAISLDTRGWMEVFPTKYGAKRKVKMVTFEMSTTAGDVNHPQFTPDMQPVALINMNTGAVVPSQFYTDTGTTFGEFKLIDTGTDQNNIGSSKDLLMVVYTDTGV